MPVQCNYSNLRNLKLFFMKVIKYLARYSDTKFMNAIKIFLILATVSVYANEMVLKKVVSTKYGTSPDSIYGAPLKSDDKSSVWSGKGYRFVWDKKRELYFLEPTDTDMDLKDLPYKFYEFDRRSTGDQNLGGLLSVPSEGSYMEVDPDGKVKKIYWKRPWKKKSKQYTLSEVQKMLIEPEVKK